MQDATFVQSVQSLPTLSMQTTHFQRESVRTLTELLEHLPSASILADTDTLEQVRLYTDCARKDSNKLQDMADWNEDAEAIYDQFILTVAEIFRMLGRHEESEMVWGLSPASA